MAPDDLSPKYGLTPKFIEKLRPAEKPYDATDRIAPGLRLRVLPTGRKVFRWPYHEAKDDGRAQRVVTYGPWHPTGAAGFVTLKEARDWHMRARDAHHSGTLTELVAELDAKLARRGPRVERSGGDSELVRDLAETFYANRIAPHRAERSAYNVRDTLDRDIIPSIGHLPILTVTVQDCRKVVERVIGRGARTHAGTVLRHLKQFFTWAQGYGVPCGNPAGVLDPLALGVENNSPQRWLTAEEIPLFWSALDVRHFNGREIEPVTRIALRLLLLLAVRTGELRKAEWMNVDLKGRLWTVPAKDRKMSWQRRNANPKPGPWYVPLVPEVVEMFEELRQLANGSRFVLAAPIVPRYRPIPKKNATGRLSPGALNQAVISLFTRQTNPLVLPGGEGGYERPTPHDLRKTARTHLDKLGCPFQVGERCLDHSIGPAGRYLLNDALDERRHFLELWTARVLSLVSPAKTNVAFLPERSRATPGDVG